MTNYRDAFMDIVTHGSDFKKALEIAYNNAEVNPPSDDKAYWKKQISTFDNIQDAMKTLLGIEDINAKTVEHASNQEELSHHLTKANEKVAAFLAIGLDHKLKYHFPNIKPAEQIALAFAAFHYQVGNGGLYQYIDNKYATEKGPSETPAFMVLRNFVRKFQDKNPEVANQMISMLNVVADTLREIESSYSHNDGDRHHAIESFKPMEKEYYKIDEEELFSFIVESLNELDPVKQPFKHGVHRVAEHTSSFGM